MEDNYLTIAETLSYTTNGSQEDHVREVDEPPAWNWIDINAHEKET